jgi:hypothetical protein
MAKPEEVTLYPRDVGAVIPTGGNANGTIVLRFAMPQNPSLAVVLSPPLTVHLASLVNMATGAIPDQGEVVSTKTPVKRPAKGPGEVLFGQEYPADILQSLGLLMVRVNLLETSLVRLLSAVSGMKKKQAESLFYSTINMKARIDMIHSLLSSFQFSENILALARRALEKSTSVTKQRNALVHGHWILNNGNFKVDSYEPNKASKIQSQTVTKKSLDQLSVDYRNAGLLVDGCIVPVAEARSMALKTATTPSSSDPSVSE